MSDRNNDIIIGGLICDPKVRPSAVAPFFIYRIHRRLDRVAQFRSELTFILCAIFGSAEVQIAKLHKREPILATGSPRAGTWQKVGANHSRLVLVAETVRFIQPPAKSEVAVRQEDLLPTPEDIRRAWPL